MPISSNMKLGQLVWLITGTSSGLGRHLVEAVLERGDRVVATVRKLADAPVVPEEHRASLHVLQLDVTDPPEKVKEAADAAARVWGQIDVLVNNAGYVVQSLLEEALPETRMQQYQTNVFGLIEITNAVLPHMRARRTGTVVMIGSRSSWQPQAFVGYYASTKAAVHALGETYAAELRPLGIRVCVVAPGAFQSEGANNMHRVVDQRVADYDPVRAQGDRVRNTAREAKGDPRKAMNVLVDAVRGEGKAKGKELPMYLLLGGVTYEKMRDYCKRMTESMDEWEDISKDLNLDEAPAE